MKEEFGRISSFNTKKKRIKKMFSSNNNNNTYCFRSINKFGVMKVARLSDYSSEDIVRSKRQMVTDILVSHCDETKSVDLLFWNALLRGECCGRGSIVLIFSFCWERKNDMKKGLRGSNTNPFNISAMHSSNWS